MGTREGAMNWSSGFNWLSTLKARRANRRSSEPDGGDMGTAFGLDASFGPIDDPVPPSRQTPASPVPWEHRVTRRSSL